MLSPLKRQHAEAAAKPLGFYESSPDLLAMKAKLLTLRIRESELLKEARVIRYNTSPAVLHQTDSAGGMQHFERAPQQVSPGARELLADLAPAAIPHDPKTLRWSSPEAKRLNALHVELTAIREAIDELDRRLPAVHASASRIYCESRHPEYKAAVERMCNALLELANATHQHDAVIADFRSQSANPAFLPIVSTGTLNRAVTETTVLFDNVRDGGYGDFKTPAKPDPVPYVHPLARDIERLAAAEAAREATKPPHRRFHGHGQPVIELPTIDQLRRESK